MANYRILVRPSAYRELKKIPKADLVSITRKIDSLSQNPRPQGSEKLSGKELYRIRQGDYRILFSISDRELKIRIEKIGHRKEIYRDRVHEG